MITASKANLRISPTAKAKIIGLASKEEKYPWIDTKTIDHKKWYQVRMENGDLAWVMGTAGKIVEE